MNRTPLRAVIAAIALATAAPSLAQAQMIDNGGMLTQHVMTDQDSAPVFAGWTAYMKTLVPNRPKTPLEKQVETEIMAARADLAKAMAAGDTARIERYLPEDYVVVMASGGNMSRKQHLDMLAKGQGPRFEVYPILAYDLKVLDRNNAILFMANSYECPKDCPAVQYPKPLKGVMRVVNVMHRGKNGWQYVLTQGLRVPVDAPKPF
jgi:Domain of unknown function (DUF4440)